MRARLPCEASFRDSKFVLYSLSLLRVRESRGWEVIFSTPLLDKAPQRVSLNTRSAGGVAGEPILAAVVGEFGRYDPGWLRDLIFLFLLKDLKSGCGLVHQLRLKF